MLRTVQCAGCSQSFTWEAGGRGAPRKYCDSCRDARRRERNKLLARARYEPRPRVLKTCKVCGEAWETIDHPRFEVCSRKCREHEKRGTTPAKNCQRCGIQFSVSQEHKVHCGRLACRLDFKPRPLFLGVAKTRSLPIRARCGWCDEVLHGSGNKTYCSERTCMRFAHGTRPTFLPVHYLNCSVCKTLMAAPNADKTYCSKGCQRQARSNERVGAIRNRVFARDDNLCQLCGNPTDADDFTEKLGRDGRMAFLAGPLYPTVDHIVPQSLGGGHEMHNLRTAHFKCNTERGAGSEREQLAWAV